MDKTIYISGKITNKEKAKKQYEATIARLDAEAEEARARIEEINDKRRKQK